MFRNYHAIFLILLIVQNQRTTGKKYVLQRREKHDKLDLVASAAS